MIGIFIGHCRKFYFDICDFVYCLKYTLCLEQDNCNWKLSYAQTSHFSCLEFSFSFCEMLWFLLRLLFFLCLWGSLNVYVCIYICIYLCTTHCKVKKKKFYKFISSWGRILKHFIWRPFYWHSFFLTVFVYSAYFVNAWN